MTSRNLERDPLVKRVSIVRHRVEMVAAVDPTLDLFPETSTTPTADQPEKDERYTTPETMAWCLDKAGVRGWDLDAAACEESHWADCWYDIQDNGLVRHWFGATWVNPPFSLLYPWLQKAWLEITRPGGADTISMILPANRTEQPFWQELVEPWRDSPRTGLLRTHFLPGRTRYGIPGNPRGIRMGCPNFSSVLLVFQRGQ